MKKHLNIEVNNGGMRTTALRSVSVFASVWGVMLFIFKTNLCVATF